MQGLEYEKQPQIISLFSVHFLIRTQVWDFQHKSSPRKLYCNKNLTSLMFRMSSFWNFINDLALIGLQKPHRQYWIKNSRDQIWQPWWLPVSVIEHLWFSLQPGKSISKSIDSGVSFQFLHECKRSQTMCWYCGRCLPPSIFSFLRGGITRISASNLWLNLIITSSKLWEHFSFVWKYKLFYSKTFFILIYRNRPKC